MLWDTLAVRTKEEVVTKRTKRPTRKQKEQTTAPDRMEMFTFLSPESKLIAGAQYDPSTQQLQVGLMGGKTYAYESIPFTLYQEFEAASSKGHFFGQRIRGMYEGRALC